MRKGSDICEEALNILRDKLVSLITNSRSGYTFDELRELLENEGIYIDGLCLRKILSDLLRKDLIKKCLSEEKHNKFVFKITC
jgi:hypothetical protein